MQKKETIWRYILEENFGKRIQKFTQKELAKTFGVSTSTVFNALKVPRKLGAVEVTGRFFRLRDREKLLLLWATQRNLRKDIIYQTRVDASVREIEGSVPPKSIFGAFSAYRLKYGEAPADYSAVYIYNGDIAECKKRFPPRAGIPNLFVLKPDLCLSLFGSIAPDSQTFADLWNIPEWYAKDFLEALKKKLYV